MSARIALRKSVLSRLGATLLLLLVTGCADKSLLRLEKIANSAQKDDYQKAIADIRKNKDLYGGSSQLLYHMDLGILFHYAGQYDSSITELSKATAIHDDLFSKSVSNEALSFLANDNVRPYRGKPHEIVLLHQFLAFDYLALGKYDDALVESRQTQLYLDELKRKAGKDLGKFTDDGMFRYLTGIAYQAEGQKDDAAISMYQAIKAYRGSPIALPPSVARGALATLKARDRENDIQELKLTDAAAGSNAGGALAPSDVDGSEIIVIGEAGRSPALGQNVFWGTWERDGVLVIHFHDSQGKEVTQVLPAPGLPASEANRAGRGGRTRSGTTFHVKFALPSLKNVPSGTRFFTVAGEASPTPVKTEALTDVEPLMSRFLEENQAAMLTRTVIRVVARTITAQETKSAISGNNPLINLLLNIGTDVLADQLEQADTRAWFLLPRTVQIARIPVKPGVHSLNVEAHDASGRTIGSKAFENIAVKPGEKKFVFYASLK
ncbi:MAG: putative lipoprotein [Fibrobacteres bacterium]|nr:putative lipoprotein [Fibrobacterota bacterium]